MISRLQLALKIHKVEKSLKLLCLRRSFSSLDCEYFERLNGAELYPGPQAQLKNRKFLPGSTAETFPETLNGPKEDFPLMFRCKKSNLELTDLARICRRKLDGLLPKYNAVVFRGMPLTCEEEFNQFYEGCNYTPFNYVGGSAVREKLHIHVYNSTVEPECYNIELHNEMSYSPIHNKKFIACCVVAPDEGGQSPLCDNRDIMKDMQEKYLNKLRKHGVTYYRNNENNERPGTFSWQNTFETKDKKKAEEVMESRGMTWKWLDNDKLRFWYTLPAFTRHPDTGEELFFNQIHSDHATYYKAHPDYINLDCDDTDYPFHCTYGNGDEIEPELLQDVRDSSWRNAVGFPWQQGDLAVVDNLIVQHSRLSFSGKRKILVGLVERTTFDSYNEKNLRV